VRHAGLGGKDTVQVSVAVLEDSVRVEVDDHGSGFDRTRVESQKATAAGGFGLHIVAMLSRACGVVPGAGVVWVEVALR
jgi:signal transduction histidine kinase